jgi:hypothetical protein
MQRKKAVLYLLVSLCALPITQITSGQSKIDSFLEDLLVTHPSPIVKQVIQNPDSYRLQIIYTEINRDKHNRPSFKNYYYHVDSTFYFNPASTVKLPLALLTLEKLNTEPFAKAGVTKFTPMRIDSSYSGQTREWTDSTSENYYPSVAHFIKKMFLVSDNDAYNRLYEFVSQQTINRKLHEKGYSSTCITHRFVRLTPDENRHTNAIRFLSPTGQVLYTQPPAVNLDAFDFSRKILIGNGYMNSKDSLVHEPFDFTTRNNLPLSDLQQILQSVLFPESVPAKQRFTLTANDYAFLYQYLSQFPGETNYPKYDSTQYYDSYAKFFFNDSLHHKLPPNVRVFNKVGWAYGFMTDVSYVADFENNVEYMLAATMYVNGDGILNDNAYEYDQVAHPFLYQLGQAIYKYELKRKRRHKPNLSRFRMTYDKRLNDGRPTVKDVDN